MARRAPKAKTAKKKTRTSRKAGAGKKAAAPKAQAGGAPPPAGLIRRAVEPIADALEPDKVSLMRELFWQNVIREILTSLSAVAALRPADFEHSAEMVRSAGSDRAPEEGTGAAIVSTSGTGMEDTGERYQPELFDGRMSVILRNGERIPIADVFPIFACSINTPAERPLAVAVECSVFQIRTPQGQVFTLPLHEIRTFHALSPELLKRIAASARKQQRRAEVPEDMPFGFAAYTSLSQGAPHVVPEAPAHPIE